ncbi:MAG: amidohydrolase family protein [Bacteroidales bacterium]
MVIDSHLHIGLNNWTERSLLNYLDKQGIEKAWILTWDEYNPSVPIYYLPLDIEVVRTAFKNNPDRIIPFYAPDPARADWKERLSGCLDEGFAGCGELKVPYKWNDDRMIPLMEFLDRNKLPLIFHMERSRNIFIPRSESGADWLFKRLINERFNGKSAHMLERLAGRIGILKKYLDSRMIRFPGYLLDMDQLEDTVKTFSGITFIGHGPHFWNHFSIPVREYLFHQKGQINGRGVTWKMLENYNNFYCDLSGLSGYNAISRDLNFSREFLNRFSEKILFGTDNMDLGLRDLLNRMELDSEKLDRILYRNARAITGH